jgi:signal-transduction protein with cAMP-binding, CBS, and nucleotidyltransferase domain
MTTAELKSFLRSLSQFEGLGDHSLEILIAALHLEDCHDGQALATFGEIGGGLLILMRGEVSVLQSGDASHAGEFAECKVLGEGSLIGLLSLVEIPALDDLACAGPVIVAMMDRAAYAKLVETKSAVTRRLQYILASRLAQTLVAQNHRLRRAMSRPPVEEKPRSLLKRWFGN